MRSALDERLTRNVKTLMNHTGLTAQELWIVLGIGKSAWYDRMGSGPTKWSADEVGLLAEMFGVEVGELYSPTPRLPEVRQELVSVTSGGADSVTRRRRMSGWLSGKGAIPKPRRPHERLTGSAANHPMLAHAPPFPRAA